MTTIVLATRNAGKLRELQQLVSATPELADAEVVTVEQFAGVDDVVETGVTFVENATLKAVAVAKATNLPAIADDSGLCVDVMGGSPGAFSARWAGEHGADEANIRLLLTQTGDVEENRLTAHFRSAVVIALPDGTTRVQEGSVDGRLTRNRRGTNGFGYDPIFELPDGRTMAELGDDEKNAISHRGKALRALIPDVVELLT